MSRHTPKILWQSKEPRAGFYYRVVRDEYGSHRREVCGNKDAMGADIWLPVSTPDDHERIAGLLAANLPEPDPGVREGSS